MNKKAFSLVEHWLLRGFDDFMERWYLSKNISMDCGEGGYTIYSVL